MVASLLISAISLSPYAHLFVFFASISSASRSRRRLGRRVSLPAARVGFDWASIGPVIDKIEEELGELRHELAAGQKDQARVADELGDVLFAVANLARHCKVDPEAALRSTNDKFERRFRYVELRLAQQGRKPADSTLEEMEALWQEAKGKA